jgi:cytochrome P450
MVDGAARRDELPAAQANLIAYIRALLADKREHSADDLISMLIAGDSNDERLTENSRCCG